MPTRTIPLVLVFCCALLVLALPVPADEPESLPGGEVPAPAPAPRHAEPASAAAVGYVGDDTCLACHSDVQHDYAQTIHARVLGPGGTRSGEFPHGCESCHGPGQAHVESKGASQGGMIRFQAKSHADIERENGVCLTCHSMGARLHWAGSVHESRDLACTSCHDVMHRRSRKALLKHPTDTETCAQCHMVRRSQTFRNAHMPVREGWMQCSSCHNPHGSVADHLLVRATVNETCYTCHADKRGPFLWEHPPVTENCLNCHNPHGSTRDKMLKLSVPRLCQQCHIETLHPTEARLPGNKFVIGSACLSCHANIHGSNHPSGFVFTR